MSAKSEEIKLDIAELDALLLQANRQRTKNLLSLELRKLRTELDKMTSENQIAKDHSAGTGKNIGPKCYEVKLNNYAWDETDKFVKLYVTLKNVQSLPKDSVYCNFTERSMDLHVLGLDNRNYQLPINNLCEEIDPERSYVKVKSDKVIVFLAKKSPKTWSHVTGAEKRIKEAKAPLVPDTTEDDPGASLINLMKKMYNEGDDEMKRTIAKAWTEK